MGHKIYPFTERQFQDDYFEPFDNGGFVGGASGDYQLLGQHYYRKGNTQMCVRDVLTDEIKDIDLGEFDGLTRFRGPWKMLTEMEVLAWASK
jgi:hypothetical protein